MTKDVRFFRLVESPAVFACEVVIDGATLAVSVWPETIDEFSQKTGCRFESTGKIDGDWELIELIKPAKA